MPKKSANPKDKRVSKSKSAVKLTSKNRGTTSKSPKKVESNHPNHSDKPKSTKKQNTKSKQNKTKILSLLFIKNKFRQFIEYIKNFPSSLKQKIKQYRNKKAYKTFHLQKKLSSVRKPLRSSRWYLGESVRFLLRNWRTMLVLILIHTIIYIAFLAPQHTLSTKDIQDVLDKLMGESDSWQAHLAKAGGTIGITLLDSGQSSSASVVIGLCMSLVFIWAIRHLTNKTKIKARDAIYQGLAPLVSFTIVLVIISIQLLPAIFASFLYTTAKNTGLLTTGFENFIFFAVMALVVLLCLYWATSAIMALYIVTLPGMYPMRALRSAKDLVVFRRFPIFLRIVALPILLVLIFGLILLAVVLIKPSLLVLVLNLIAILAMPLFHTYLYKLYRSLI